MAAVLLSIDDFATRHYLSETIYGNLFLLLIGGPIVGLMVDSLLRSAARTAAAERAAAAAVERTKLARAVHDGVLQVLSLVQRRAPDLGEDGAQLGRLAGEQEQALRSLIRQQDAVDADTGAGRPGRVRCRRWSDDRGCRWRRRPAGVPVEGGRAAEIVAVVAACLDNVAAHVGPDAPAWVLLESAPDELLVSVRDDGPGIPPGRLDAGRSERVGSASPRRSGAGSPSSADGPSCPPDPTAPSGSWPSPADPGAQGRRERLESSCRLGERVLP